MAPSERIGVDPVWQRIVVPSTACLRLGMLLALVFAQGFHVEVAQVVSSLALVLGLLYFGAYGAVMTGHLSAATLAYAAVLDTFLLGGLLAGSGAQAPMTGFLCLLGMALAHMCGGVRLGLAASAAMAAGWVGVHLVGSGELVWSGLWSTADFHLGLEPEITYQGHTMAALTDRQVVRAAVASFLLISLSGCLAFARALWERRRVARACAEVDALEAIVDCYTSNASEQELWQTVSRSASRISGAHVLAAHVDGDVVRLEGEGGDAGDAATWHGLRIPLSVRSNPIVHSIVSGREAETEDVADLCGAQADGVPPEPRSRRRAHYVIVPVVNAPCGAALVAVVHGNTRAVTDGLRLVAERAGLVLRARQSPRARLELEPAPTGA